MDRPHGELDLSLIVCVSACPARDNVNTSAFHFEIHFSGNKGSPWLLRAQTQVCKLIMGVLHGKCTWHENFTIFPMHPTSTHQYSYNVPGAKWAII